MLFLESFVNRQRGNMCENFRTDAELAYWREHADSPIVVCTGCFDIFHFGHASLLRRAKILGDILVVGINSDQSVKQFKPGLNRPINSQKYRFGVLDAIRYVDVVHIYEDTTRFLELIKPDFWVKGGDYTIDSLNQNEVKTVEKYGGKVVIVPMEYKISTTSILNKI